MTCVGDRLLGEREREGGEGGGGREGGRERERGREGGREGGREEGREREAKDIVLYQCPKLARAKCD